MIEPKESGIDTSVFNAICSILNAEDNGFMATKFVLVCEGIGSDGQRALWTVAGPADIKSWDTAGMLKNATDMQSAQVMSETFAAMLGIENGGDE